MPRAGAPQVEEMRRQLAVAKAEADSAAAAAAAAVAAAKGGEVLMPPQRAQALLYAVALAPPPAPRRRRTHCIIRVVLTIPEKALAVYFHPLPWVLG